MVRSTGQFTHSDTDGCIVTRRFGHVTGTVIENSYSQIRRCLCRYSSALMTLVAAVVRVSILDSTELDTETFDPTRHDTGG